MNAETPPDSQSSTQSDAPPGPPAEIDFEQSLAKLEEIVRQLEMGELGLSESLQRYEEGVACLRACQQALGDAESRIELLFRIDDQGQAHAKPFERDDR